MTPAFRCGPRRPSLAVLALLLLILPALPPSWPRRAQAMTDPVAASPLCSPSRDENLSPHLGGRATATVLTNGSSCNRFFFEVEPGAAARVMVTVQASASSILPPAAVTFCSWDATCAGSSRVQQDGPVRWTSAAVENPVGATVRANHFVQIFGAGVGSFSVTLAYGALPLPPDRDFGNAAAWRPAPVRSNPPKAPVTGDWDHTLYNDPSYPGLDACLALAQQDDANASRDAPNAPAPEFGMPLGIPPLGLPSPASAVRLGQRGVYINNRVGTFDHCPGGGSPAGRAVDDAEDWYSFVVQPGAQALINLWPTRYDVYGGGFHYQLFRVIPPGGSVTSGEALTIPSTATAGEILCGGDIHAPYEPVFNPALDCNFSAGAVPGAPTSPNAQPTRFYLRVFGAGFVRYTMTVDYVGCRLPEFNDADACDGGPLAAPVRAAAPAPAAEQEQPAPAAPAAEAPPAPAASAAPEPAAPAPEAAEVDTDRVDFGFGGYYTFWREVEAGRRVEYEVSVLGTQRGLRLRVTGPDGAAVTAPQTIETSGMLAFTAAVAGRYTLWLENRTDAGPGAPKQVEVTTTVW